MLNRDNCRQAASETRLEWWKCISYPLSLTHLVPQISHLSTCTLRASNCAQGVFLEWWCSWKRRSWIYWIESIHLPLSRNFYINCTYAWREYTVYRPCNFFRLFLTSLTLLVVRRKFFESVERNSYFFSVGLIAFKILR